MITFYTGTPGGGKSFHLAEVCYRLLRFNDINIIANFDINLENAALSWLGWLKTRITEFTDGKVKFRVYDKKQLKGRFFYWDNSQITVKNLLLFAGQHHTRRSRSVDEPQTLLLIDEAGLVFNCRGFSDKSRNEWVRFFAKHRHYCFDVILACQFDRQVDKQIRCCVEYEKVHRKLKNYKFLGWLLATVCGGNIFLVYEKWYMNKMHVCTSMLRYSLRIGALYDTLRDFDDDLGASCDTLPQGVAGDRGPSDDVSAFSQTAPEPSEGDEKCHTNDSLQQLAGANECVTRLETFEEKLSHWAEIMGGGTGHDNSA